MSTKGGGPFAAFVNESESDIVKAGLHYIVAQQDEKGKRVSDAPIIGYFNSQNFAWIVARSLNRDSLALDKAGLP